MSRKKSLKQQKYPDISENILRAFSGESLTDIAIKLGEKPSTFWNWAKGRTKMPSETLANLAIIADTTIEYLLTGKRQDVSKNFNLDRKSDFYSNELSIDQILEEKIRRIVREEIDKRDVKKTTSDTVKLENYEEFDEVTKDYVQDELESDRERKSA